jgi:HK97 family phage major capsid protein
LACLVPCSIELLEDSPNAGQVITGAIQKAMAAEIDRVILRGSGAASEPCGIRSTTGVNANTGVAGITDYSDVTSAVMKILASNYPGEISALAWLQHPVIAADYDGLVGAVEGQPLEPTPWARQLMRMYSTNLPALAGGGTNEYSDIVGDFSQVVVGMRTSGVVVEVLNSGSGTDAASITVNATSDLMRWIRCYIRLDVGVLQPSWFCINPGITT